MRQNWFIYPSLTEPISQSGEAVFESKWHQPWTEPVRFRIDPRRKIAIDSWLYRLVQFSPFGEAPMESKFHFSWSEPVRQKKGMRAWYQRYDFYDLQFLPEPDAIFGSWYPPLTEPVRLPKGLRARYHPHLAQPSRVLPPVDMTVTLTAFEVNEDVFEAGLNIEEPEPVPSREGASVTIIEIAALSDGAASIGE